MAEYSQKQTPGSAYLEIDVTPDEISDILSSAEDRPPEKFQGRLEKKEKAKELAELISQELGLEEGLYAASPGLHGRDQESC